MLLLVVGVVFRIKIGHASEVVKRPEPRVARAVKIKEDRGSEVRREAVGDDVLKRSECLEASGLLRTSKKSSTYFLRGPTRPSGVRSTRPSAPSSRTAVSARAAREREAAPEISSGRDGAAREGSARVVARGVVRPSAARRRRGGEDRVGRLSGGGAFGAREASVLGRLVAKCDV